MKITEHIEKTIRTSAADFNIPYLHLELLRIDLLIRQAVQHWQQAGQNTGEKFRGLFINEADVHNLLNLPMGGYWGAGMELPVEDQNFFSQNELFIREEIKTLEQEAFQAAYGARAGAAPDWHRP